LAVQALFHALRQASPYAPMVTTIAQVFQPFALAASAIHMSSENALNYSFRL